MKKQLLLLTAVISCSSIYAQEDAAIQQWQSNHPTTLLISASRYASFSDEEKALIGTDYILFENKVTLELLEQFDQQKGLNQDAVEPLKEGDADMIKNWMSSHREVKIVRQSAYIAFAPERQQYCIDHPLEILVLDGESITIKDIERYGH